MESKLIHGDCLMGMHELAAESVDVVVTSPPYNLGHWLRRVSEVDR